MALFDGDKNGVLWDSLAVPNAFICEYLPAAPEGYVKVYLYGLLYARFPSADEGLAIPELARTLGMEESDVTRAFQYWERCRLVTRTQDNPPRYCYLSVQQAMLGKQAAPADEEYMQFAQALYALFGDKRKLHGGDTQLCYEWVEQLGLPREVVLMLVQHLIHTRGVQFSFKDAQKLAVELCDQHISTVEAAEQLFSRSESAWKGTQKILRRMSKFRPPMIDEIDLYLKWTGDWGFAPKAIENACAQMIGGDPSFKYLDGILKGVRERSGRATTTAAQLDKQLASEGEESELIRDMLKAAGLKNPVNGEGVRQVYRGMRALVDAQTIQLAAEQIGRTKKLQSLEMIVELVGSWQGRGLTTADDVRAYLRDIDAQNEALRALYALAGSERKPNQRDRELLRRWKTEWGLSDALIEQAARYAEGKENPGAFMGKLLESWRAANVDTVEKAKAEHAAHAESAAALPRKNKTVEAQQYEQREYDPKKYEGLTEEELEEVHRYDS